LVETIASPLAGSKDNSEQKQDREQTMANNRFSGMDELMIVNPGLPNKERTLQLGEVFLGEDGVLYSLGGLHAEELARAFAEFYLGEDGTLYRLERFGPLDQPYLAEVEELENPYPDYFLGEDGMLYQVIRS
jgi:hypothetical protein